MVSCNFVLHACTAARRVVRDMPSGFSCFGILKVGLECRGVVVTGVAEAAADWEDCGMHASTGKDCTDQLGREICVVLSKGRAGVL